MSGQVNESAEYFRIFPLSIPNIFKSLPWSWQINCQLQIVWFQINGISYVKLRAGLHRPTYLLSFLRNNIHLDQSQRSIISHDNCSSPIGWRQAPSSLDIALLARPHEPLQAAVAGGGDLRHLLLVDVLVLHEDDGLLPGVEARQGFISKRCECNRAGWTVTCPGAHCVYVHHLLR